MSVGLTETILLGGHISVAGGVSKSPSRAEVFKFGTMQIFSKNQMQWKAKLIGEEEAQLFRDEVKRTGLRKMMIHGSYLLNMASSDDKLRAKVKDAIREEIRRADLLGIDYLVIHPGSGGDDNSGKAISNVGRMINECFEEPGKAKILLETGAGQGHTVGHTFEQLASMIDAVDKKNRVAVCMDTCHVFAAGYDVKSPDGYEETMDKYSSVLGLDSLRAFHLNDSKKDIGSRLDRHEQLGKGLLGIEGIANFINDKRFRDTPFVMETPKGEEGYDEDIAAMNTVFKTD